LGTPLGRIMRASMRTWLVNTAVRMKDKQPDAAGYFRVVMCAP